MKVIDRVNEYLESQHIMKLTKNTQELYRYALEKFVAWGGNLEMEDAATNIAMEQFAAFLDKKETLSGKSVQKYIVCVKLFLRWHGSPISFEYRIASEDRKSNKQKHLMRWLSEDDIEKCLTYEFKQPFGRLQCFKNKIVVRLLVETGARIREIANVKAKDINVEDRIIWLMNSKTEPRPGFFSPITQGLLRQLTLNIADEMVFGEVAYLKWGIKNMLSDLGMKTEEDGRGPHTFRHFAATRMFYDGNMKLEDVSFLLGDTMQVIEKYYLHPTPKMLKKKVDKAMRWADLSSEPILNLSDIPERAPNPFKRKFAEPLPGIEYPKEIISEIEEDKWLPPDPTLIDPAPPILPTLPKKIKNPIPEQRLTLKEIFLRKIEIEKENKNPSNAKFIEKLKSLTLPT